MLQNPLISFVLPAYKRRFFKMTIDSILNQTYSNFELVVVDDDSPENLKEIINLYDDKRIRYIKNDRNIGGEDLVAQWNHSIRFADGEYIVLASDDDIYKENFLEKCVELVQEYPQVDVVRSRVELIDEKNNIIGVDGCYNKYSTVAEFFYQYVYGNINICIANYMFKSRCLKNKEFINQPYAFGTDIVSVLDMGRNGILNTNDVLFSFRMSSLNLSNNKKVLHSRLQGITQTYRWLMSFEHNVDGEYDKFYISQLTNDVLINKCCYDYYNSILKYIPFVNLPYYLSKCEYATARDKIIFILRYMKDHLL